MKISTNIKSFSFAFLIAVLLINLIDFSFGLGLTQKLAFNPKMILQDYQMWRLLTYPFVITKIEFALFFSAVFLFVSPMLETYLNKYLYPVFLFLAASLQGFVLTLAHWNNNVVINGVEGLTFFILILMLLLKPNARLIKNYPLKVSSFSLVLFGLWVVSLLIPAINSESLSFAENYSSVIFGATLGVSIFFPIKYMQKYLDRRRKTNRQNLQIPKPEELQLAMISSAQLKKMYSQYERNLSLLSDDPEINEEILNKLLDKINEQGKESLTGDELRFLEDYSRQI